MDKKIVDINCFSIYFVKNHPGHDYVKPIIDAGLRGEYRLVIPEILPFRAFWIMTTKWGIPKDDAKKVIVEFLHNYSNPVYVGLARDGSIKAFQYSNDFNHDVYDCYYLSIAIQEGGVSIITTDVGFEKLCEKAKLNYENPVPLDILRQFSAFK
nr:PIN domain-containing protein [Candidatus Sigynarchaeota archaeon]